MVEKDLFTVQRLNIESKSKLREIAFLLKPHFAIPQWDTRSERLLQEKVQYKIKRIRATLLSQRKIIRGRDGYVVSEEVDDDMAFNTSALVEAVQALPQERRGAFLDRLFEGWDMEALSQVTSALTQRLRLLGRGPLESL